MRATRLLLAPSLIVVAAWTGPGLAAAPTSRPDAEGAYKALVEAYLHGKWDALGDAAKAAERIQGLMTPQQRQDIAYIRKAAAECHPPWWTNCKSTSKVSFKASIWDRPVSVNYVPADKAGWTANADTHRKTISVVVSWNPAQVDETKPLEGELKRYEATSGDIAELTIWYHLGTNFVLSCLPLDQLVAMYADHKLLFDHFQDFLALQTAVYHTGPRARLTMLMLQLGPAGLRSDRESQVRASRAFGSMWLAEVLTDPTKWPNVHLPATAPEKDVEETMITNLYANVAADWTLAEDKALRELIRNFVTTKADQVLRTRGEITLANKLSFKLQAPDDRELQKKRDAWIVERVNKLAEAKSGQKNP
jgi:hypothetical protein